MHLRHALGNGPPADASFCVQFVGGPFDGAELDNGYATIFYVITDYRDAEHVKHKYQRVSQSEDTIRAEYVGVES